MSKLNRYHGMIRQIESNLQEIAHKRHLKVKNGNIEIPEWLEVVMLALALDKLQQNHSVVQSGDCEL